MVSIVRIGAGSSELAPAEEIGAKAAILARVASAGVTVPPAFVLPISLGAAIASGDHDAKHALKDGLKEGMAFLEDATGLRFGDRREPLLVSVRSGAARSMPGMLDSLLDVGCTTEATRGLIRLTGNPALLGTAGGGFSNAGPKLCLVSIGLPLPPNATR